MPNTRTLKYGHKKRRHWKPVFLSALGRTGVVGQAAEVAGISPTTAFRARDLRNREGASLIEAQQFAKAWDTALTKAADRVDLEVLRRAVDGVEREYDVYYKGEKVGTRTVLAYSDRLLMFLAKALRPERYGQHSSLPEPTPNPEEQMTLLEKVQREADKRWAEVMPLVVENLTEEYGELLKGESVESRLTALGVFSENEPDSSDDSES